MSAIKNFFIMIIATLLIAGCAPEPISQHDAEARAADFVSSNVKFFAKEQSSKVDLPQYTVESTDSYRESGIWVVVMHISSQVNGSVKKNDLIMKFDRKGDIAEFNGKKLP